jgi:hypothetical protein
MRRRRNCPTSPSTVPPCTIEQYGGTDASVRSETFVCTDGSVRVGALRFPGISVEISVMCCELTARRYQPKKKETALLCTGASAVRALI